MDVLTFDGRFGEVEGGGGRKNDEQQMVNE